MNVHTIFRRFPFYLSIALPVVILLASPVVSRAQCPTSTVSLEGTDCGEVVFSHLETSTDAAHSISFGECSASYNLADGTLHADVHVKEANEQYSRAIAVDRFELHNVPAALLKIRLYVSMFWQADPGNRMAWSGGAAKLTVGCCSEKVESFGPSIDSYVELEVAVTEGDPFDLTYETEAWGQGYYPIATMSCRLEFVDLPPGAEITSCNGFGDSNVPVEQTSWGQLKALYRQR